MSWTSALVLLAFCAHALATCPLLVIHTSDKATIHETKDTYNHKETISYTCNTGFQLNDNKNTLECQKNGKWKPNGPKCRQIKCKTFEINKGTVKFNKKDQNNMKFNTKATITCFSGYQLRGQRIVTCGANGSWSPDLPTCEREIKCKTFEINKGTVKFNKKDQNNIKFNTKATITCFSGYQLRGQRIVTCGANGSWSPDLPTCERVTCPLPAVNNSSGPDGRQEYEVGEQITISCQEGFELIGSSQVTCEADGQWQRLPQCRLTGGKCLPPPHVTNAYIGQGYQRYYEPDTPVRFKCNQGYRMVRGPSTTYCSNGQWTNLDMVCEKKKCGSAGEIENGRYHYNGSLFGDTVTASCDEGFHLVGLNVRHCRANGWDGRAPVCEAIACPEPPQVPYADLDFETNGVIKSGHMASYSCRIGKLIGASDIICTEDGTWSAPPPLCEVATCRIPNVRYGVIVSGQSPRYVSGSSVRFKCSSGKLLGPEVITCGTDGFWTPRLPLCEKWDA